MYKEVYVDFSVDLQTGRASGPYDLPYYLWFLATIPLIATQRGSGLALTIWPNCLRRQLQMISDSMVPPGTDLQILNMQFCIFINYLCMLFCFV